MLSRRYGYFKVLCIVLTLCIFNIGSALSKQNEERELEFKAISIDKVINLLGATKAKETEKIKIEIPSSFESAVPVTIKSEISNTAQIFIIIENNLHPLAAKYTIIKRDNITIKGRYNISPKSDFIVLVKADGVFYKNKKNVKSNINMCNGFGSPDDRETTAKMRINKDSGETWITSIILNPMESGKRINSRTKERIKENYIKEILFKYEGSQILKAELNNCSLAKNPYLSFNYDVDNKSLVSLLWKDNKGNLGNFGKK